MVGCCERKLPIQRFPVLLRGHTVAHFWENAGAIGRLPRGVRLFSDVRQKPYPVFVECLFNLFAQILLWLSFCFLLAFSCYK